jgi:SAM-dependent methyltransferase
MECPFHVPTRLTRADFVNGRGKSNPPGPGAEGRARTAADGGGRGTAPFACRSCGSRAATLVGAKRGSFIRREFEYWKCPDCDYLFVEPFSGYAVYDQAYYEGRGPDPYVDYESEFRDFRATDRVAEFDGLWRSASGFLRAADRRGPLSWLDFGCGAGGFLAYLREKSVQRSEKGQLPLELTGHDVGTYAGRIEHEHGFRILGLAGLEALPDASFDVVSMVEVIEHIEFPEPVFALVARLLKPGGLLLLTTGNVDSPVARAQGLSYAYMVPEIHVGLYTPRALELAYARHGLVPVWFRHGGAVRFKVIKTLRDAGKKRLARLLLGIPFVVEVVDLLYGTSKMPSARKPG